MVSIKISDLITLEEEDAEENEKLMRRYDDASGYTRSKNAAIRTSDAKKCEALAKRHRMTAQCLKGYRYLLEQIRDGRIVDRHEALSLISSHFLLEDEKDMTEYEAAYEDGIKTAYDDVYHMPPFVVPEQEQ